MYRKNALNRYRFIVLCNFYIAIGSAKRDIATSDIALEFFLMLIALKDILARTFIGATPAYCSFCPLPIHKYVSIQHP